jgi:GT2 family glycosyltransferase
MNANQARDISVIIVSWNVREYLKACLASIYRSRPGADIEVIVADNKSSDESPRMVEADFPQVKLIVNSANLGYARANNIALKESKARNVLFLNPDTEVSGDTLPRMKLLMDRHAAWSGLACKLIYPDGALQENCRHFPSIFTDLMESLYLDWAFPKNRFFNYYRMGSWGHDRERIVDVPYGACFMVRRSVLDNIGPMDERFFMYYDEIDLCRRIKKAGGSIWYIPGIKVIHHSNKSSDQIPDRVFAWKYASKILYFEKHFGRWSVCALAIDLILKTALVWGLFGLGHLIFSIPKDLEYIKRDIRAAWRILIQTY